MTKSQPIFFEYLLFPLLIAISIILCLFNNFSLSVIEGIKLWAASVLPSLFPYFFISTLLSSLTVTHKISKRFSPLTKSLFNVGGGCGYAFLLSLISGYPIGAKTVADLKKNGFLGEAESVRAAAICSTSSPMFLIGSVGGIMFNSSFFGILLLLVHVFASFCVGFIFSFYRHNQKPLKIEPKILKKQDNLLYESVYSSVISVLVVGGLITIFYLLTEILSFFNLLTPLTNFFNLFFNDITAAEAISLGLFECTKGLKSLSMLGVNKISFSIAALLCGFGGISVIMQSIAYLKSAKIKTAPFLVAKLTHAVLSFSLAIIFSHLFL